MAGFFQDTRLDGGFLVLFPDQPRLKAQLTALVHVDDRTGVIFLLKAICPVQNSLQTVQFRLTVLIQNIAVGQFLEFLVALGLHVGQVVRIPGTSAR